MARAGLIRCSCQCPWTMSNALAWSGTQNSVVHLMSSLAVIYSNIQGSLHLGSWGLAQANSGWLQGKWLQQKVPLELWIRTPLERRHLGFLFVSLNVKISRLWEDGPLCSHNLWFLLLLLYFRGYSKKCLCFSLYFIAGLCHGPCANRVALLKTWIQRAPACQVTVQKLPLMSDRCISRLPSEYAKAPFWNVIHETNST